MESRESIVREMRELRNQGVSVREIAERFGVGQSVVYRALRKVERRTDGVAVELVRDAARLLLRVAELPETPAVVVIEAAREAGRLAEVLARLERGDCDGR